MTNPNVRRFALGDTGVVVRTEMDDDGYVFVTIGDSADESCLAQSIEADKVIIDALFPNGYQNPPDPAPEVAEEVL